MTTKTIATTRKITTTIAALSCSAALIGGLAACSDDEKSESTSTTTAAAATTGASSGGGGSASSITIDGTEWEGDFSTDCAKTGDSISLAISEISGDAGKGAGATVGSDDTVSLVGIGDAASGGLGYNKSIPGGSAKLEKDGNTYTITGEAIGVDLSNPTEPKKSTYELVFACDRIVGE